MTAFKLSLGKLLIFWDGKLGSFSKGKVEQPEQSERELKIAICHAFLREFWLWTSVVFFQSKFTFHIKMVNISFVEFQHLSFSTCRQGFIFELLSFFLKELLCCHLFLFQSHPECWHVAIWATLLQQKTDSCFCSPGIFPLSKEKVRLGWVHWSTLLKAKFAF